MGALNDDIPMAAKNEKAPMFISAITIAVIAKNRASGANTGRRVVINAISKFLSFALAGNLKYSSRG
jgi:hypothetical protein